MCAYVVEPFIVAGVVQGVPPLLNVVNVSTCTLYSIALLSGSVPVKTRSGVVSAVEAPLFGLFKTTDGE